MQKHEREIVRKFKRLAAISGKDLRAKPARNGLRLICDGRPITLPQKSGELQHTRQLAKRLGLSATPR